VLGAVDEREGHRQRVEAEANPHAPARRPEEEQEHQRIRGVQRGHRGDDVHQAAAVLEQRLAGTDAEVAPHRGHDPVDGRDLPELGGQPRRLRRIRPVRGQCGGRDQHGQGDVAAEAMVRDPPQDRGGDPHGEEVRQVDAPDGDVQRAHVAGRVEVLLQPDRRQVPEEEGAIDVDLRLHVRVLGRARHRAADVVVGDEQREERQPLEQQQAPPAPRRDAEGGHPEHEAAEQRLAPDRRARGRDVDRQGDGIGGRHAERQHTARHPRSRSRTDAHIPTVDHHFTSGGRRAPALVLDRRAGGTVDSGP
jgi:hypothetical protein